MLSTLWAQKLLDTPPAERAALIRREIASLGEPDVHALAEHARATAASHPAESLLVAELAWTLADTLAAPRGRALALRARAVALWIQGRSLDALDAFEAGARAAEEAGDALLAAQIPIAATLTLAQVGRYDEAIHLADDLERRLKSFGAEEDVAKILANTGIIHSEREAYSDALRCYQGAAAYFEARGQTIGVARLRMNMGNVLTHLSQVPEALAMYGAARATFAAAAMQRDVAALDGNRAFLLHMTGRYTEALRAYQDAKDQFAALALTRDVAQCDREIADVSLELNLIPEAQEAYQRVLPVFEELSAAGEVARVEIGVALLLTRQGKLAAARTAFERAEQAFTRDGNEVGAARARLQRLECDLLDPAVDRDAAWAAGARRTAVAARQVFRRHGLRLGELQARLLAAESDVEAGLQPLASLRRLDRDAEAGGFLALIWRIEAARARAFREAGRERAARLHYRRAVDAIDRVRLMLQGQDFLISFLRDKLPVYEELLELLLKNGGRALREAFQLVERAKSRTLLERLAGSVRLEEAGSAEPDAMLGRLEEIRASLNWDYERLHRFDGDSSRLPSAEATLADRIREREREYLELQRRIELRAGHASPRSSSPLLDVTVGELQETLRPDEQLVEFVATRDGVTAFLLDRRHFRVLRDVASRGEVEREAERLQYQWGRFMLPGYAERFAAQLSLTTRQILAALYTRLLRPLEPWLTAPCLTIVPHGVLHGVPFHALRDGEQYAIDRWEMVTAPSASIWRAGRLRPPATGTESLLFGVPAPELEHVGTEIATLQALLPGARVYEGAAATLAAVPREGNFRYLHFASHAVFRQDNPLFSGLRMADGWLIAHDLYRRRLDCELATLSACRTGMMSIAPGDEVLGLARGFLHAGARAVVVSLWTADDAATSLLMEGCYRRLAEGRRRATALRLAAQQVREQFPEPYHWAPFILVGAG